MNTSLTEQKNMVSDLDLLQGINPNSITGISKEYIHVGLKIKNEYPDRLVDQIRALHLNRVNKVEALNETLTIKLRKAIDQKNLTVALDLMSASEISAILRCEYLYDGQLITSLYDRPWLNLYNSNITDKVQKRVMSLIGDSLFFVCMVAREKALTLLSGLHDLKPHLQQNKQSWANSFVYLLDSF